MSATSTSAGASALNADPRYPVGRYTVPDEPPTRAERARWISEVTALPATFRAAVAGLGDAQLDTPYRDGGWTVRQVAHHLPDSHMNAYVRFKLAATETDPTIKPYDEAAWARLPDSSGAIAVSLDLLEALHARWTDWLAALDAAAWERAYVHPESGRVPLEQALQLYAWHGDHHLAHVRGVRERAGR